eukprot:GHVT01064643.1.p1 GENE.GHVT01064643.1~~GHVT01064643.1.p1  ORF type:complete len:541 (+),score=38.63 GHVT01064643.1:269-1891(+)
MISYRSPFAVGAFLALVVVVMPDRRFTYRLALPPWFCYRCGETVNFHDVEATECPIATTYLLSPMQNRGGPRLISATLPASEWNSRYPLQIPISTMYRIGARGEAFYYSMPRGRASFPGVTTAAAAFVAKGNGVRACDEVNVSRLGLRRFPPMGVGKEEMECTRTRGSIWVRYQCRRPWVSFFAAGHNQYSEKQLKNVTLVEPLGVTLGKSCELAPVPFVSTIDAMLQQSADNLTNTRTSPCPITTLSAAVIAVSGEAPVSKCEESFAVPPIPGGCSPTANGEMYLHEQQEKLTEIATTERVPSGEAMQRTTALCLSSQYQSESRRDTDKCASGLDALADGNDFHSTAGSSGPQGVAVNYAISPSYIECGVPTQNISSCESDSPPAVDPVASLAVARHQLKTVIAPQTDRGNVSVKPSGEGMVQLGARQRRKTFVAGSPLLMSQAAASHFVQNSKKTRVEDVWLEAVKAEAQGAPEVLFRAFPSKRRKLRLAKEDTSILSECAKDSTISHGPFASGCQGQTTKKKKKQRRFENWGGYQAP